jgi:acyl-coenzyme A thioesterase PaaI-like protein
MNALPVYKASFFLNQKRNDGLRLKVAYETDHVYIDFRIGEQFRSETGSLYNGILFGIMDVLMWYAILIPTGKVCMTRKIDVEFFKPVSCNNLYRAKSKLLSFDEKGYHVTAWIEDSRGQTFTKVTALFKEGKGAKLADIIDDLDFSGTTPEMRKLFDSLIA